MILGDVTGGPLGVPGIFGGGAWRCRYINATNSMNVRPQSRLVMPEKKTRKITETSVTMFVVTGLSLMFRLGICGVDPHVRTWRLENCSYISNKTRHKSELAMYVQETTGLGFHIHILQYYCSVFYRLGNYIATRVTTVRDCYVECDVRVAPPQEVASWPHVLV
jgi:hypothetical protein